MVDRRPRLPFPTDLSADKDPDGRITAGVTPTLWTTTCRPLLTKPLERDIQVEACVVGAGISGLTTAYLLAKAGIQVAVLDDGAIGSGETGRTTAHFTNALDDRYHAIESKHGKAAARLAAQSHTQAIATVARIIEDEGIRCQAERVDGYLLRHPSDKEDALQKELEAARRAGLDVELAEHAPHLGGDALRFPDQLQLHPLEYLRGLAKAIEAFGGQLFTQSHARFPDGGLEANGHKVKADRVLVCTNSPVTVEKGVSVKQAAFRTYVIACELPKGKVPHAMWWDTGDFEAPSPFPPYHYVRVQTLANGREVLISGGQDHLVGHFDKVEVDPFTALEEWTRQRWPEAGKTTHSWSGEVFEPADHLAYIGPEPHVEGRFIATGDSGNGVTHGTLAGIILSDLARGLPNPYAKLYDPKRKSLRAAPTMLRNQLAINKKLGLHLKPADVPSAADLAPGEGAVLGGPKPTAVYRDDQGRLHACRAICPHLGGVVAWNPAEKSFDCTLHGSRFTAYGKAICGPTNGDLEEAELDPKERGPQREGHKRPPARSRPKPRKAVRASRKA